MNKTANPKSQPRGERGPRARLGALLSLPIAVAVLVACSGAPAAGGDQSLQTVKDRGVLRASACLTLPPFGMIASNGEPEGFDVDLLRGLGDHLGVEVEIIDVAGPGRVASLQSGQADVSACTFSITPERLGQVWFTDPILRAGTSLMVRKDSGITTMDELDGRTIANTKGGGAIPILEAELPGAKLVLFDTVNDVFLALRQGQVDAAAESQFQVSAAAAEDPDLLVIADGTVGEAFIQALGVAKGNQTLLDAVNEYIAEFHTSGQDVTLFEKWFTFDVTNQFTDLPKTENLP